MSDRAPIDYMYGIAGAPLVFYDHDLYLLALKEAGFEGVEFPALEYPFKASWEDKAWRSIVAAGHRIVERSGGKKPWIEEAKG